MTVICHISSFASQHSTNYKNFWGTHGQTPSTIDLLSIFGRFNPCEDMQDCSLSLSLSVFQTIEPDPIIICHGQRGHRTSAVRIEPRHWDLGNWWCSCHRDKHHPLWRTAESWSSWVFHPCHSSPLDMWSAMPPWAAIVGNLLSEVSEFEKKRWIKAPKNWTRFTLVDMIYDKNRNPLQTLHHSIMDCNTNTQSTPTLLNLLHAPVMATGWFLHPQEEKIASKCFKAICWLAAVAYGIRVQTGLKVAPKRMVCQKWATCVVCLPIDLAYTLTLPMQLPPQKYWETQCRAMSHLPCTGKWCPVRSGVSTGRCWHT